MEIVHLSKENLYEYEDFLGADIAENIGREFYRGMVACEGGEPEAGLIWELTGLYDDMSQTQSRIEWYHAEDAESLEFLLDTYTYTISKDGVEKSFFEFEEPPTPEEREVFTGAGFELSGTESRRMELRLSDLKALKLAKKLKTPPFIKSINGLVKKTFARGMTDCIYNTDRELQQDLIDLPMEWYDGDVSCYEDTDTQCGGFLLVHGCPSGKLRIELLSDWGPDPRINLLRMIRFSLKQACDKYPDDTRVEIIRRDNALVNLMSYLFPDMPGRSAVRGVREEEGE